MDYHDLVPKGVIWNSRLLLYCFVDHLSHFLFICTRSIKLYFSVSLLHSLQFEKAFLNSINFFNFVQFYMPFTTLVSVIVLSINDNNCEVSKIWLIEIQVELLWLDSSFWMMFCRLRLWNFNIDIIFDFPWPLTQYLLTLRQV